MFITENQSIGDSVLFLLAARETLSSIIEGEESVNKDDLIKFIQVEASDYQVMNLLLKGTLPEDKYNAVDEALLFSEFKESMLINKNFVTEITGEDIFYNVLNEVDSLYMVTSTQKPVLELAAQTNLDVGIACAISELTGAQLGPTAFEKAAAASKPGMLAALKTAKQNAITGAKAAGKNIVAGAKTVGGKIAAGAKTAGAKTAAFAHTKAGMVTGGAAAAALAIYAGYKIYKRFLSQAARSCAGQSGAAKTACMNKFKKQAIIKQASAIQSASGTCAKSKNPEKCKAAVAKKVAALKLKASKIA